MKKTLILSFVKNIKSKISRNCLLVLVCFCTSCGSRMLDKQEIMDQYGVEVINYFYETAFHGDKDEGRKKKEAYRWKGDIRISLHGDLLKLDSSFVQEALSEINSLDIPVSMYLVSDPEKSNMKVFFGDAKTLADALMLDSVTTVGVGVVNSHSGRIEQARIGILEEEEILFQTDSSSAIFLRKGTILEEMTQALGIVGDSYTYYNSHFFEGKNEGGKRVKGLSEIDKKTLKFLYDKRVFKNHKISRQDFEQRFSDVLYDRIHTEKFSALADEYGLDKHELDSLGDMVFRPETDNTFAKFPRTTFLKLSGDTIKADVEFCRALVPQLNSITPYFQLELAESSAICNRLPSITVHYENRESHNKDLLLHGVAVNKNKMMFTYLIKGDIWLKFNDPENKFIPFKNEKTASNLFKTLGIEVNEELLTNNSLDSLEINKKYENYFRFLYDPRFPSGISKGEFSELVKKMD